MIGAGVGLRILGAGHRDRDLLRRDRQLAVLRDRERHGEVVVRIAELARRKLLRRRTRVLARERLRAGERHVGRIELRFVGGVAENRREALIRAGVGLRVLGAGHRDRDLLRCDGQHAGDIFHTAAEDRKIEAADVGKNYAIRSYGGGGVCRIRRFAERIGESDVYARHALRLVRSVDGQDELNIRQRDFRAEDLVRAYGADDQSGQVAYDRHAIVGVVVPIVVARGRNDLGEVRIGALCGQLAGDRQHDVAPRHEPVADRPFKEILPI